MFKMRIIGVLCWLGFVNCSEAQQIISALPRWMISVHMDYNIPQSPVNRILDRNQIGIHAEAKYRLQYNKPILAGVYFNEFTLSKYALEYEQTSASGNFVIREKANTIRYDGGLVAGFYPEINWLIQPYLQGYAGLSIYESSSVLKDKDEDEIIEVISESRTFAPSYGLDLGFHIVPNIWYVRGDIRIGFTGNTSTSFLVLNREEAGTTGFPIEYFDHHTAAGKWFRITAGISYLFGS